MNKTRNCSIDMFRYVCSVLVVAIHANPFGDFNDALGFLSSQVVTRIAVPFFFMVSGYFYFQGLEKGKPIFIKYLKSLFKQYFFWSLIYYLIEFVKWGTVKPFFRILTEFFITGTYYHLWFFPALIISVIFSTVFWRMNLKKLLLIISVILYIIGCLCSSYYYLFLKFPVFKNIVLSEYFIVVRRIFLMGLPFFVGGCLLDKITLCLKNKKKIYFATSLSFLFWLIEIVFVVKFELQENIVLTFGLYPMVVMTLMVLINNPLHKFSKLSLMSKKMADFTYYFHPIVLLFLQEISFERFHFPKTQTLNFFLTVFIVFVVGLVIIRSQEVCSNCLRSLKIKKQG